jgi:hypothetical protein
MTRMISKNQIGKTRKEPKKRKRRIYPKSRSAIFQKKITHSNPCSKLRVPQKERRSKYLLILTRLDGYRKKQK